MPLPELPFQANLEIALDGGCADAFAAAQEADGDASHALLVHPTTGLLLHCTPPIRTGIRWSSRRIA